LTLISFGQSQRLVLLEHFTQASCGPCATYNPQINTMLANNPDKFTAIMYHTSWPGYDPMYNHNTVENGARTTYYSVNSVPNSVLDGNIYNGHPNGWNINTVNSRYDVPSPCDVYIHHELSADETMLYVNMMIHATESMTEGWKAQLAVIEKYIYLPNAGSNGEDDFYNVMKKMLPNQAGTNLPAMEAGDYVILQFEWEHQNVYDLDELAAVGFVQNNDNKEVLQAANSSDVLFDPMFANDAEVTTVQNFSYTNCNGMIQPEVTVRNNGSDVLTTMDIHYTVNGEDPVVYNWTGNLGFLESETVLLPEADFAVLEENQLVITLENPNGIADEYVQNNTQSIVIDQAPSGDPNMTLYMVLDDNPEETTWEVTNYQGDVIHQGGPYSTPGETILEQLPFTSTNCYTFTIYDAGGDGLSQGGSIAFGFGSTYLINAVNFGSKDEAQFSIEFTGVNEPGSLSAFSVFPNPAGEVLNIRFTLDRTLSYSYTLLNSSGQEVLDGSFTNAASGQQSVTLDLNSVPAGIYYLQLTSETFSRTEKIVIR
jgi:hypothetical protein